MTCSFRPDFIVSEFEWSECLYWRRNIRLRKTKTILVLLYSILMQHWDDLLLQARCRSRRVRVKWVSVLKKKHSFGKNQKNTCLTSFTFNASLRWPAPSGPILFPSRLSEVSICIEEENIRLRRIKRKLVLLYSILMHHLDGLLLHFRFYFRGDRMKWVPVLEKKTFIW